MSETQYDVWVVSDVSGRLVRYTQQPFLSKAAARRWAQTYVPAAAWDVRPIQSQKARG